MDRFTQLLIRSDKETSRLIEENADLRALIRDIADYMDVWSFDDEALANPTPGTLEALAARMLAVVRIASPFVHDDRHNIHIADLRRLLS